MTSTLIKESREDSLSRHVLVEYRDAFISGGVLTVNGRSSTNGGLPGTSNISAGYPIDAQSELPDPTPSEVVMKYRRMPRGGRPVPIEHVALPYRGLPNHEDPRVYDGVTPTNTVPALIVNIADLPAHRAVYVPRVNRRHVLYAAGGPTDSMKTVVIDAPVHEKVVSTGASLVLLPFAVAGDIVTFPIQALAIYVVNGLFQP